MLVTHVIFYLVLLFSALMNTYHSKFSFHSFTFHNMKFPSRRIQQESGRFQEYHGSSIPTRNFSVISSHFLMERSGKYRKSQEKSQKISQWEHCFHLPVISYFLLQDMRIFPVGSCSILSPELSTWIVSNSIHPLLYEFFFRKQCCQKLFVSCIFI